MALKNAFRASLQIGPKDWGNWDAFMGGDFDMSETKYTPADGIQRTYVGVKTTNNITLETDYREEIHGQLLKEDPRGIAATAVIFDRDPEGNFQQNRPPYFGVVKQVVPPDGDSNDAATIVKIQVIISVGNLT